MSTCNSCTFLQFSLVLALLITSAVSTGVAEFDAVDAVDDESSVLLLQTGAGLLRQGTVQPTEADAQALRLAAAMPLVYFHVPKTGSSIVNALVRLPGACPDFAAELGDDSFSLGREDSQFQPFRNNSLCEGLAPAPHSSIDGVRAVGYHSYAGSDTVFDEHFDGHGVAMLRQPEQRVISGMRHFANAPETDRHFRHAAQRDLETVQFSEGCTTRLLAGEEPNFQGSDADAACFAMLEGDPPLPEVSAEDTELAVARLRRFAFVGITEEWQLSVCLLHAMFGGECHNTEFTNTRPSWSSPAAADLLAGHEAVFAAPEPYDTSILDGWVDAPDRAVYDAGLEMFHGFCEEYDVTHESCRQCYENAGLM